MKKSLICTAALLAALSYPVLAAPSEAVVLASKPGAVTLAGTEKASATITAIDAATRKLTLQNAEGQSFVITAGDNVKNFAKLKVGDKVQAQYLQVLELELLKTGSKIRQREVENASEAASSAKAGGAVGEKITFIGNVLSVNTKNQTIRVQGVDHIVTLKVRDPEQFKLIKKGDQIKGTYTEAFAMVVSAAK